MCHNRCGQELRPSRIVPPKRPSFERYRAISIPPDALAIARETSMSGVRLTEEPDVFSATDSRPPQPPPHHELAAEHTNCPCYLDPRCQMAVAFQGARDYWARHPNDAANARNEVHESIEEWLVAKRLLKASEPLLNESPEQSDADDYPPSPSPARRAGFKLPRIKPLNLGRRLSLPGSSSRSVLPLLSPDRRLMHRRNTDGDATRDIESRMKYISMSPKSPKKLLRDMAGFFRSTKHKHSSASYSGSDASQDHSDHSDLLSIDQRILAMSETHVRCIDVSEYAPSIYEDASDAVDFLLPPSPLPSCLSQDSAMNNPNRDLLTLRRAETPLADRITTQGTVDRDPAYTALVPILYEIDALADNPKFKTIAAENHDEDYERFWETFAQLSAKEVLSAVYAIRSGVLDVPLGDDRSIGTGVVILALWACVASVGCIYLSLCLR
ncbi:hypothetical protein C8Q78DRAFT_1148620 [Trametes maxima]|nr:hypothetical protein C8Q78DRAFT_1148620 [Trametes maxima]